MSERHLKDFVLDSISVDGWNTAIGTVEFQKCGGWKKIWKYYFVL